MRILNVKQGPLDPVQHSLSHPGRSESGFGVRPGYRQGVLGFTGRSSFQPELHHRYNRQHGGEHADKPVRDRTHTWTTLLGAGIGAFFESSWFQS
ncbi:hypothetical protein D3C73_1224680 [compost metagenome]